MHEGGHDPKECAKAGCCVCSGDGRLLRSFRNSVLRAFKAACPPQSADRSSLVAGDLVLRLTSQAGDGALDAVAEEHSVADVFLHVSLMYLKPFRPTFHRVKPVPPPLGEAVEGSRIFVKAHGS